MTDYSSPRPVRRRRFHWGWWLLGLIVIALVLYVILRPVHTTDSKKGMNAPMPVSVATAQKGDIAVTLNALGTVTPITTSIVRAQIAGYLQQIAFQEGQEVKQGDFLAQIDPRPYQAALAQQEGTLAKDQALLKDAQIDLKRYQLLVQQDSIARQQLDTQTSLVHQYEGAVKTDEAAVANARLNLVYCHITAPVSGRIGLRQVDLGNYVQESDTNGIVVITQMHPMSVIFVLPEDNLPAILQQLHAGQTLATTAYDRSQTTKLATGVLATLDNQVDTATGTIKFRALFDNNDELLFPNQFVNIQLLVQTVKDALVIPTAAVQRGAPGTFVYLVQPDSTVTVRPIKLGPGQAETVAVTDGLQEGDQVVTDGADKLKEGGKVILPGAKPEGGKVVIKSPMAPKVAIMASKIIMKYLPNHTLALARGRGQRRLSAQRLGEVGEGECCRSSAVVMPAHFPAAVPLTLPRLSPATPGLRRGSPLPRGRGANLEVPQISVPCHLSSAL